MLAVRDQENLVAHHHNGAALKQQGNRQLPPKTPGQKVPLNDENASRVVGGGKSALGGRSRGNENVPTTAKGFKKLDKSSFVTPMEPRVRAVLGDKTTNAKAKGQQSLNAKSAITDADKSQTKAPTTVKAKQKQQAEVKKLQVHAERTDPLVDEEVEYCPPRPKDLPYESDVFPDGVLTFEALKSENLFQGYYDHYFNPVDENGKSLGERQMEERNRKAAEECDRRVQQDMDEFDWSVEDVPESKDIFKKNKQPLVVLDPTKAPIKAPIRNQTQAQRKPLSTVTSRNAAAALGTVDDGTKSMQRRAIKAAPIRAVPKRTAFGISSLSGARKTSQPRANIPRKKTSMEIRAIEANSRSTIGYSKGRATASALTSKTVKPAAKPGQFKPKSAGLPRSETVATTSSAGSDKTITPSRLANVKQAAESDEQWKERVPFLSIFNAEDDDDLDFTEPGLSPGVDDEDDEEEFQMQLPE